MQFPVHASIAATESDFVNVDDSKWYARITQTGTTYFLLNKGLGYRKLATGPGQNPVQILSKCVGQDR